MRGELREEKVMVVMVVMVTQREREMQHTQTHRERERERERERAFRQRPLLLSHLDHDEGVGGLHGEEEVVVVVLAADAGELEGGLHHAPGRVAVEAEDAGGEGT